MPDQRQPTIFITGATRGIGRAIALRFAAAGFRLALVARTATDLEALQQEITALWPERELLVFPTDVGDATAVSKLAGRLRRHWTQLDVLVNNAGLFVQDKLLTEPEINLDRSLQVNLYGPYRLCRALLPLMLPHQQGLIINVSSVAARKAYPNSGSYTISKHAQLGLSRALRLELQDQGIRVTAILPGSTWTSSWEGEAVSPERLMAAEDVATAAFAAWELGPRAVMEEVVLRPQLGDL